MKTALITGLQGRMEHILLNIRLREGIRDTYNWYVKK